MYRSCAWQTWLEFLHEYCGVMEMLTEKDASTGEYKIPKIIYSDAYSSEMVIYADLIFLTPPTLNVMTLYHVDRPICEADAVVTPFVGLF